MSNESLPRGNVSRQTILRDLKLLTTLPMLPEPSPDPVSDLHDMLANAYMPASLCFKRPSTHLTTITITLAQQVAGDGRATPRSIRSLSLALKWRWNAAPLHFTASLLAFVSNSQILLRLAPSS